ncbi:BHLH domain-containing protein [Pseudozyma hubeiensis]|nr:BHLH domain-containing protein [Pseudozyma hubeiensis]
MLPTKMSVLNIQDGGYHDFANFFDMISSPLFDGPCFSGTNTEALSFTSPLTTSTQSTQSTPFELASCSTLASTSGTSPPVSSKRKHSEVERDRRRSISDGFTMLQNVLHNDGDVQARPISKSMLLKQACNEIRELRRKLDASTAILSKLRLEDVLQSGVGMSPCGSRSRASSEASIPSISSFHRDREDKRSQDGNDSSSVSSDGESETSKSDADPAELESQRRKIRASREVREDANPRRKGRPSRRTPPCSDSSISSICPTPSHNAVDLQQAILSLLLELPHRMEEWNAAGRASVQERSKKRRR